MQSNTTFFCDLSALGKIQLSGEGAEEFIKVMTTVALERITLPGQASPALVLNSEGEILDLVLVLRTGEFEFVLTTHPDTVDELTEWLDAHAKLRGERGVLVFRDIKVSNETASMGTVALYGTEARMILDELSRTDTNAKLENANLALIPIGDLEVMLLRWPLLDGAESEESALSYNEVYEIYLPLSGVEALTEILLSFHEIDPESFEEYKERRRASKTWFGAAEEAAYIKPTAPEYQVFMRSSKDFVGAKALD